MRTVPVEISDTLAALLDSICAQSGRPQEDVLKEMIVRYLEDTQDIADAARVLEKNEPAIPLEEIERKYGLAD